MASTTDRPQVSANWEDSLGRSKAQIEAGLEVPLKPVLDRLKASAARMEARRDKRSTHKA
jgi:hypothetical protein